MSSGVLARQQYAFTASIRDPEKFPTVDRVEPRRMKIYQELFYNNVEDFLSSSFPIAKSLWSSEEWQAMIRGFLKHHRASSPLFLDMPLEFMDFLQSKGASWLSQKPFLLELLHYEWIELSVWLSDDGPKDTTGWSDKHCPVINASARLLAYQWPVHQISADYEPADEATPEPTFLLVYRDLEDVRFTLLTGPTYQFLAMCDGETTLETLVTRSAEAMNLARDTFTSLLFPLLEDFHQKKILQFVKPPGEAGLSE